MFFKKKEEKTDASILSELHTGFGKLVAHTDYVEIVPAYLTVLGKPSRRIFYANISAISFEKPSLTNLGYFQFIVPGENSISINKLSLVADKNFRKAVESDPNVLLTKYTSNKKFIKECQNFVDLLNSKIGIKSSPVLQPVSDNLDQIKKLKDLLDCGAITQPEFDEKKKQLLGI